MASDYDVVVLGSGVAGLSAALEARQRGCSVLVAEAEDVVGGSSRLAGGSIMGAGTRLQHDTGVVDSGEELFQYYMALNHWGPEPAVVRRLAEESGPMVDWLADLGVAFEPVVYPAGEEPVPRKHLATDAGAGVVEVLHTHCVEAGVEFAMRRRVDRLLRDGDRVSGVAVGSDEVTAGAVIVATGGFGADEELVFRHLPDARAAEDWFWYVGAPGSRGDALALAEQVDAEVLGHNTGLLMLTPNFGRLLEGGYLPGWLVVVNATGRRFYNETVSYSVTDPIVRAQPTPLFAIFDHASKCAARPEEAEKMKRNKVAQRSFFFNKWVEPMLDEMIDKGVVVSADSLDELGAKLGLPSQFVAGIERYNDDVARGVDELYEKDPRFLRPVATPPFYATELRLAHLPLTGTGMRIDADARVLDRGTNPIPGLYAAGECTGGILGTVYVGSGNSLTGGLVFGRVAGRNAAAAVTGGTSP